jgi:hypothetical protein
MEFTTKPGHTPCPSTCTVVNILSRGPWGATVAIHVAEVDKCLSPRRDRSTPNKYAAIESSPSSIG